MSRRAGSDSLIAAQRRRTIVKWAEEHGAVNVTQLAETLGVAASTIRQDLGILHNEGKLVRTYGGAIVKDTPMPRVPYAATRDAHMREKAAIGDAALKLLPTAGFVFIGAGTTTYEMAIRLREASQLQVVTNCPRIAWELMGGPVKSVHMLGGPMMPDAYCTDCLLDPALDALHWDVAFIGMPSLDLELGMTEVNYQAALFYKKVIEHSGNVVVLADSSKFGVSSYATVGPVDLVDVLITDAGVSEETVRELADRGVEVIVAGRKGDDTAGSVDV